MSENNGICDVEAIKKFNYPKWTGWDLFRRHLTSERMGGGEPYLHEYKDGYIVFHRDRIRRVAAHYRIPVLLLAGVAWEEAGGKPDEWKYAVFSIRRFDWSGPDWVYKYLTLTGRPITKPPERTSFGIIAMQSGVAAGMLFPDAPYPPTIEIQEAISQCLMMDVFNVDIVAKHLHDLILYDYPNADTLNLTEEQSILAASRYNRGIERKKADFIRSIAAPPVFKREDDPAGYDLRDYTSYGRRLMERRVRVQGLLM